VSDAYSPWLTGSTVSRSCSWVSVGRRWPFRILYKVERSILASRASSDLEPGYWATSALIRSFSSLMIHSSRRLGSASKKGCGSQKCFAPHGLPQLVEPKKAAYNIFIGLYDTACGMKMMSTTNH